MLNAASVIVQAEPENDIFMIIQILFSKRATVSQYCGAFPFIEIKSKVIV
jgi:hypothetical protein